MVFTSLDYALLLIATLAVFWTLPARFAEGVLLVASLVFYAYWSVPYTFLFVFEIVVGHAGALAIDAARRRGPGGTRLSPRGALAATVVVLFGLLAYFKYANLILDALAGLGLGRHGRLQILLPLGISFHTFQIVGYLVDVYRGFPAERSFASFALFTAFFPQLIAGPISRAHDLVPRLQRRAAFDPAQMLSGLELIAYGLAKKMVVADNLGVLVDRVYSTPATAGGLDVVIATVAFGAQIYGDFSGYTDIARGSSRLLGIELPLNFRSPYVADSVSDFWRRWHITLSSWLRDYLYIPLGGNRARPARVYANLFITMTLGGLWHGASVTFLLWGAYHGLLLIAERARGGGVRARARRLLGVVGTFVGVQVGWAIFRARDFATLAALGRRLVADPLGRDPLVHSATYLPLIVGFYGAHVVSAALRERPWIRTALLRPAAASLMLAAAVVVVVIFGGSSDAFIYFQF